MRRTAPTCALLGLSTLLGTACERRPETEAAARDTLAAARRANLTAIEHQVFDLVPEDSLPADDLPARRLAIELPDRTLYATWVSSDPSAPAFFFLHGNGETIAKWRPLQAYLLGKGYSSFVFDYTGFGSSTGTPTVERLNQDAVEAYRRFAEVSTGASERIAFGHSLGSAVLLEVANRLEPRPSEVVVHGAFTSGRAVLVTMGIIEPDEEELYPDVWNGLENVQTLEMPLFIVHSVNDQTNAFSMGEELAAAAGGRAIFLPLNTPKHDAIYEIPTDATWDPILDLIP